MSTQAQMLNNYNRIRFRNASFYVVAERDTMMGGWIAYVYAVSVEDQGRLHGSVGGAEYEAMENAGAEARQELLEAVEDLHYRTLRCVVYGGIAPAGLRRAADRWIEMLGLDATYTGRGTHLTTVRVAPGSVDASLLTRKMVTRIMEDAALRLSQGLQNCSAEYDVADRLMTAANFADAPEEIRMALWELKKRLQARCNGHDLGVGAMRSKGPLGESWWDVEA